VPLVIPAKVAAVCIVILGIAVAKLVSAGSAGVPPAPPRPRAQTVVLNEKRAGTPALVRLKAPLVREVKVLFRYALSGL